MAERRPVVLVDGDLKELPSSDTLPGQGLTTTVKRLTADGSGMTTTTLSNEPTLLQAVAANEVWSFEGQLWITGSTTGDLKLTFTYPTGASVRWRWSGNAASATAEGGVNWSTLYTASGGVQGFGTVSLTVPTLVLVVGMIANGATAGTLQLQAAQNVVDAANPTTIRTHSYLLLTKLS